MDARRYFARAILCFVGLCAVILIGTAVTLDYAQRTRGVTFGFPEPIEPYVPNRPAVGVNVALEQYGPDALRRTLAHIDSTGMDWIRQTFAWADIQPEPDRFEWAPRDRIVNAIPDNHIDGTPLNLIAVLDTAPSWSHPTSNLQSPISNLQPPTSNLDFANFARAFAQRYGDRIDYYQIWDEPNLGARWNGEVNPVAYAEMLRQARDAIREVDPNAIIILAGLAPTVETSPANMADWLFLRKLYEAGAKDLFDVAAGKPYGFETGPDDRRVDPSALNFSHILLLREEMEAHGDAGKALWASHLGWNTHPQSIWGRASPEQQAQWIQDAVRRARDEWPWMGVMVVENWQPLPTAEAARWGFALLNASSLPEPVFDAVKQAASEAARAALGYHPSSVAVQPGSGEYAPNPFATFTGDWKFGELGADWSATGESSTFPFEGASIALRVRRAADRANLYLTVDGQPANALPQDGRGSFMQLIPPNKSVIDVTTLPAATGLSDGPHTLEAVAERGWNQWSLIGWSVGREEDRAALDVAMIALGAIGLILAYGAVRNARRAPWDAFGHAITNLYLRLNHTTQLIITASAAFVFYTSAWLTWGAEAGSAYRRLGDPANVLITLAAAGAFSLSPWLILTLASGMALFVLILLRLDLGLMLVAFFAPFHLLPANLFYRFSSMAEMTLIMCAAAWALRRLAEWRGSVQSAKCQGPGITPHASRFTLYVSRFTLHVSRFTLHVSRFTSLDWAVLAFFVVSTISLFAASYFEFALREWRIIILEPVVFYALLRSSKLDRSATWRIIDALVLAGVLVAAIGLVEYTFNLDFITAEEGTRRLRSVYGSPNNVGLFLGRVLPIALAFLLLGKGRRRTWYGLALIPIIAAIVLSQSRGAIFLGVPASILAIGLLAGGRWIWVTLGALLVGAIAAIPFFNSPRIQALLGGGGTQVFRIALWRSALNMIREHPVLGVGPDNFLYAYRGRYMLPEAWQEPGLSHPHNVVLDFGARLGLLGLAAFVWIQIAFWRSAYSVLRETRRSLNTENWSLTIGLMASMVDFLAHGLVDAAYFVVDLAFVFMLTLAIAQRMRDEG
ncbi:MAG TPA: O-antigen ligase family protein [Anaerolineae bacterium]|nr:O-antigen ligase family protein [Anaerolineae bacterium]